MAHETDLERQIEFDFLRATEIAAPEAVLSAAGLSEREHTFP